MFFLGSFLVSMLGVWGIKRMCIKKQLFDIPNSRSSHVNPTPRGGGIAFILTFVGAGAFLLRLAIPFWLFLPGLGIAVLGAIDDYNSLSPLKRFLTQFFLGVCVVFWGKLTLPAISFGGSVGVSLPPIIGFFASVFFIVATTNIFNFMDGIDGYAGGVGVIASFMFGLVFFMLKNILIASLQGVLIAALLGFLVWNYPKARIFMGDSGSSFLGFYFAVMSLWLVTLMPQIPIIFPMAWFSVFLMDAFVTLVRRFLKGEKLWEAHRDHFYQLLNRSGWSHEQIIWLEFIHVICVCGLSWGFLYLQGFWTLGLLAVIVCTFGLKFWWITQRFRRCVAGYEM